MGKGCAKVFFGLVVQVIDGFYLQAKDQTECLTANTG